MRYLNTEQLSSLSIAFENMQQESIEINPKSGFINVGDFKLCYEFAFGNWGVIGLNDFWLEQNGHKYIIPSVIHKPIEQYLNRLGKPVEEIPEGTPTELIMNAKQL